MADQYTTRKKQGKSLSLPPKPAASAPKPGEIWFITDPALGNSKTGHYVLVLDVALRDKIPTVWYRWISSEIRNDTDFEIKRVQIHSTLWDECGLTKNCYIRDSTDYYPLKKLIGDREGSLTGDLLQEVTNWFGRSFVKGVKPEKTGGWSSK